MDVHWSLEWNSQFEVDLQYLTTSCRRSQKVSARICCANSAVKTTEAFSISAVSGCLEPIVLPKKPCTDPYL